MSLESDGIWEGYNLSLVAIMFDSRMFHSSKPTHILICPDSNRILQLETLPIKWKYNLLI